MKIDRVTLRRLFAGDIKYGQNDAIQNIYVFRFELFCFVIYSIVALLNFTGVFIINHDIARTGYMGICLTSVLYFIIVLLMGFDNKWVKYISITAIGIIVLIGCSAFTYHMVIIYTFPIVAASMYDKKRLRYYAFFLTIFCIAASTYIGYYYGICDANMVLITCDSYWSLVKGGTFLLTKVNDDPLKTLFLYYILPRSFLVLCFQFLCNVVNYVVRRSMENAVQMQYKALRDGMTGLYNKRKLMELLKDHTRDEKAIAVVYWDVNQLKYVNDNWGHLCGDQLITVIAETIRKTAGEQDIAIRYGGDEFLLYIVNGNKETAMHVIEKWERLLETEKSKYEFPVSASVGYATGTHAQLESIIAAADKSMYANKSIYRE